MRKKRDEWTRGFYAGMATAAEDCFNLCNEGAGREIARNIDPSELTREGMASLCRAARAHGYPEIAKELCEKRKLAKAIRPAA